MIEIKAWRCEFCKKVFISKSGASRHEKLGCYYNPATRSCRTCVNLGCRLSDEGKQLWSCGVDENFPFKVKIRNCKKHEYGKNSFDE